MKYVLVNLYQVCSNGSVSPSKVLTGGGGGGRGGYRVGAGFDCKIYLKIFFSRTAKLSCLKFGMLYCFVTLNQVAQKVAPSP